MMPDVTVGAPPLPSALPMAITVSLTATCDESPSVAAFRLETFLILMTATSLVASYPSTLADFSEPLPSISTRMSVAPSITWLLVSTTPSEVSTMPVPAASPPPDSVVLMFTTDGLTLSETVEVSTEPLLFDDTIAGGDEPPELRARRCARGRTR